MEHLKKIKCKYSYQEIKRSIFPSLESRYQKIYPNDIGAAVTDFYLVVANKEMVEFGMEKFYHILAGIMFQISKGVLSEDLAYEAWSDIKDFNTGEYDSLIPAHEIEIIRNDAKNAFDAINSVFNFTEEE